MLKKSASAVAGAAGLVVATTGCGIIPGLGASPTEVLQQAVQDTRDVGSYRVEMTSSGTVSGTEVDTTMEMVYTDDPEPTVQMTEQSTDTTTLMRGSEMLVDTGSGWTRSEMSESPMQQGNADPKAQVDQLLASEDVEETGSEDVNGSETTVYEGSYPVSDALEQIEDEEAKDMAQSVYDEAGISEIPFTAWIDGDGMPARVQTTMDQLEQTMDFVEFGQDVTIEWPSEDEISDGMGGGGGGELPSDVPTDVPTEDVPTEVPEF